MVVGVSSDLWPIDRGIEVHAGSGYHITKLPKQDDGHVRPHGDISEDGSRGVMVCEKGVGTVVLSDTAIAIERDLRKGSSSVGC